MKNKNKVQTKEVPRIVWFFVCPKCKKEISGNYESQAILNMKSHLEKHKKEKK